MRYVRKEKLQCDRVLVSLQKYSDLLKVCVQLPVLKFMRPRWGVKVPLEICNFQLHGCTTLLGKNKIKYSNKMQKRFIHLQNGRVLLCLELPCLVQEYSRSASHTCSMWRANSVHVMELLSDCI